MKNRILLINTIPASWITKDVESNIPPGLLAIGTWITKNSRFEVKIIDCLTEENYLDKIKKEIQKDDIIFAGLSVMSPSIPNAMEITRLIKKTNPKLPVVWGGIHCKLYPEQTCRHKLIDFVIYREGEKPSLNLANCLVNKKSLRKVKGIIFKEKGKLVRTEPEEPVDLNELGIMNYELLNPKIWEKRTATINTSRGCPHRCTFCINVVTRETRWRALTPENVIKEIEHLVGKHHIRVLGIGDECFFVDRERCDKIIELLLEKKFKLSIYAAARADYFTKGIITQELLNKAAKAGFDTIGIGAEFGSQKMLDFIKKDITEKDILTSVKMLKKAGIGGNYAFMTGFPNETKKDTLATINMIKKMFKMNKGITVVKENGKVYSWIEKLRVAGPQVYRPYPGGELYEYIVKEYNWHAPETLEEWEKYFKENTRYRIEDYPWIKNPNFYAALQFYAKSGKANFTTFFKRIFLPFPFKYKIMSILFYPFAKIRMSFNFFDFPFEYIIGKNFGLIGELET